jgi:hypothetical protein
VVSKGSAVIRTFPSTASCRHHNLNRVLQLAALAQDKPLKYKISPSSSDRLRRDGAPAATRLRRAGTAGGKCQLIIKRGMMMKKSIYNSKSLFLLTLGVMLGFSGFALAIQGDIDGDGDGYGIRINRGQWGIYKLGLLYKVFTLDFVKF